MSLTCQKPRTSKVVKPDVGNSPRRAASQEFQRPARPRVGFLEAETAADLQGRKAGQRLGVEERAAADQAARSAKVNVCAIAALHVAESEERRRVLRQV